MSDEGDPERLRELLLDMERANQREREQRQESEALLEGLRALAVGPDEEPRYEQLLQAIQPLLEFDHAAILTLDADGAYAASAATTPAFAALRWPDGPIMQRARRGAPVAIFDVSRSPEWLAQPDSVRAHITSALHIALGEGEEAAMLLCVHHALGRFTQRHAQLARRLSLLASQAVLQRGLRRRIRQREHIFALSRDLLAVVSMQGRFLQANPAWSATLDHSHDALLALPHATALLAQQDGAAIRAAMEELRQGASQAVELDVRAIKPDGALRWLRWSMTIEREEAIFLVSAHDITDLREAEQIARLNQALARARDEAVEASTAKSLFLANISHELRTPLNAVLGYAELLEEELDAHPQALDDLTKIRHAGRHLLSLITNLFDLSRIELGRMEVHNTPLDVEALIEEILSLLKPAAQATQTEISWQVAADIGEVLTDAEKLRQIVVNLVSNAVRHAPQGLVTLRTGLRGDAGEQQELYLSVADTGVGMTEAQLASIFDPFAHTSSSIQQRAGHTGIGLSLSRRYCQMLGGDIRAKSVSGQGTTFVVTLPIRRRALMP